MVLFSRLSLTATARAHWNQSITSIIDTYLVNQLLSISYMLSIWPFHPTWTSSTTVAAQTVSSHKLSMTTFMPFDFVSCTMKFCRDKPSLSNLYKAEYYYLSLDYVEEDPKFPQSLKLPDKIEVDYWSFLNIKIENWIMFPSYTEQT